MSYGAEEQFENEALMAVRTANFISAFLQVVDPKEIFPGTEGKFIQNKCRRPELYSLWGEGEFVNRISARLRAMSAWTEGG